MSVQGKKERHVHFAPEQLSGSHRPPEDFRTRKNEHMAFAPPPVDLPPLDQWTKIPPLPLTTSQIWKARGIALIATITGIAKTLLAKVKHLFAKLFQQADAPAKEKQFKNEWEAVKHNFQKLKDPQNRSS